MLKGPPSLLLTLLTPLVPLYRGAVKAPWAALAAAWRTAWLDMTPVANSAWAFWKLASVCLYRLWTWRGEEQSVVTPNTCTNSSSYFAHYEDLTPGTRYGGYSLDHLLSMELFMVDGPAAGTAGAQTRWKVPTKLILLSFFLFSLFQEIWLTISCHNNCYYLQFVTFIFFLLAAFTITVEMRPTSPSPLLHIIKSYFQNCSFVKPGDAGSNRNDKTL